MKKIFILIVLVAQFTCLFAQTSLKAGVIAFYNLENLFDTINTEGVLDKEFTPDGQNKWNQKKYFAKIEKLAGVISRIGEDDKIVGGPAIIGVAEIENRSVLEDLIAHPYLKNAEYKIVHYNSPDRRGIDVALLYQSRYFILDSSKPFELILKDEEGKRVFTRDQLLVSGKFMGEDTHFIVNHWPSRRGGAPASNSKRLIAAKLTRSIVDSLQLIDSGAKIIVMGDFNDDPDNESMVDVLKAKDHLDNLGSDELYNCMFPLFKKGLGTLAYRDKWNLFDQILVSKGLLGNDYTSLAYYAARVYNKAFLIQQDGDFKGYPYRTYAGAKYLNGFSDHFPVYIIVLRQGE